VAESREVLLQALRERHGLQLQENLLNVQRRLSFGTGPTTTRAGLGQSTILEGVGAYGGWPAGMVYNVLAVVSVGLRTAIRNGILCTLDHIIIL
jgi:hypothetical protein